MDIVINQQKKRMHPHKFTLWVAIGSIVMMFAGLTSAFIVKSNQAGWQTVNMPQVFWASTAAMLLSSFTLQLSLRSFKKMNLRKYQVLTGLTLLLGITFVVLQWLGFRDLWQQKITFKGAGAGQFLYVIFGLHALHVLGGIIALIIMFVRAFRDKTKLFKTVSVEVMTTYWHFADLLWIYLLVFFLAIG